LICWQFLSWSQVSCVYASRRFIPVFQESQITFFLSFFIVFYLLIIPTSSCTLYPQLRSSSSITESITVLSLWWQWWRLFLLHHDNDNYNDYGMVGEGDYSSNEALDWSAQSAEKNVFRRLYQE
jgi:hypothetical protein